MESENNSYKHYDYERLRQSAISCAELKDYERAQKIVSAMVKRWPERVIARGEATSDVDIPDSKLDSMAPTP